MEQEKYIQTLAEHYQKTFEVTYEMWKQRNKLYLVLLSLVSVATLVTFQAPQANSLLIDWVANLVGVTDPSRIAEIRVGFPFAILQSALVMAVFYVMINLYQHNRIIWHNDSYLRSLEKEMRDLIGLEVESKIFTRESSYNTGESFRDGVLIARTYVVSLGLLLSAFLGGRIVEDIRLGNLLLVIIDSLLSFMIFIYFFYMPEGPSGWEKEGKREQQIL